MNEKQQSSDGDNADEFNSELPDTAERAVSSEESVMTNSSSESEKLGPLHELVRESAKKCGRQLSATEVQAAVDRLRDLFNEEDAEGEVGEQSL